MAENGYRKKWDDKEEGRKPWEAKDPKPLQPAAIRAAASERKPKSTDADDLHEKLRKRNMKFALLGGQRGSETK